jgi:hypothetical protein
MCEPGVRYQWIKPASGAAMPASNKYVPGRIGYIIRVLGSRLHARTLEMNVL